MNCYLSIDSHFRTTRHLPYHSISTKMYGSPPTCFLCNSPERSICSFCPGSVNTDRLIFSPNRNWLVNFLSQFTHAVHVIHVIFYVISHPGRPEYVVLGQHFRRAGFSEVYCVYHLFLKVFGDHNFVTRKDSNESFGKFAENQRVARSFWLFRWHILNCNSFGSTNVLWIKFHHEIDFSFLEVFLCFGIYDFWFVDNVVYLDLMDSFLCNVVFFWVIDGKTGRRVYHSTILGARHIFGGGFLSVLLRTRNWPWFLESEISATIPVLFILFD